MNLKDNDDEIELTSSSSHQQGKQSMSSQKEHKTAKRSAIESDYLSDDNTVKEDLCETLRETQSVSISSLNQFNISTGSLNQFNVGTGLSNQLNINTGSLNQLSIGTDLSNQLNVTAGSLHCLKVSTGSLNQFSVDTDSSNQLNVTADSLHHLKVDTGSLHCLKVSTGSLNQFNVSTGLSNQLNVTAGSSHHEKLTDVEETYSLSQSVYFKIGHKINVEAGVTENLDTTEIIDKNSDTTAEQ